MITIHPGAIIVLGFVLVLLGAVLPFLMVVRIIQPNLPLSFLSYMASVAGLALGLVGTAYYARNRRRK